MGFSDAVTAGFLVVVAKKSTPRFPVVAWFSDDPIGVWVANIDGFKHDLCIAGVVSTCHLRIPPALIISKQRKVTENDTTLVWFD
mmetsp:Transcript_616/g.1267  ORF Transcript_616/g.1267 Transcript_616/m.1267 type:complete len:85 (-) Transcript_616:110-364(-)